VAAGEGTLGDLAALVAEAAGQEKQQRGRRAEAGGEQRQQGSRGRGSRGRGSRRIEVEEGGSGGPSALGRPGSRGRQVQVCFGRCLVGVLVAQGRVG
jgi:hypothetical protein